MAQKAEEMLPKTLNKLLCNVQLFPRVWILEISRKAFGISLSVSGSRLKPLFGYPYPVANSLSCRISNWQTGYLSSLLKIRDDRIVDFYYPILSCFFKMISVPDSNPVLVETMLSVSENYPKVYCDAQHTFLCCVYFASWGKTALWCKIIVRVILPSAEHDWLK